MPTARPRKVHCSSSGCARFERQFLLAPGHFENFADVEFLGVNDKTLPLFDSFKDNGDRFNPRFDIDAVSTRVDFGTLQPGDTLDVVYQLTAVGTTGGGEEGFVAFLGDPFEVSGTSDAFVVTAGPAAAAVPEPATWVLMIVGFGVVAGFAGRRRVWAPYVTSACIEDAMMNLFPPQGSSEKELPACSACRAASRYGAGGAAQLDICPLGMVTGASRGTRAR